MLYLYQAIILGTIQGLAEFLPISSSAHLWGVPYLFNWVHGGLKFDTALHMGTVAALLAFFWRDWLGIFRSAFTGKNTTAFSSTLLWQIVLATIPAAIAGVFLEKITESKLQAPLIIAFTMMIFGIVLWLVDKYAKSTNSFKDIGFKQSFLIGLAQALALIPGVSRSGITMVAARSIGLKREDAARFSFLIGTPATVGAFLYESRKLTSSDLNLEFFTAVLFATVFGFIAIKFLLNYLKKSNFKIFVFYRIIFALFIILIYLLRR
ncbi:MAG: undecaprenyl-diphosphate phosphatase [Patescibacteria group bacterium]